MAVLRRSALALVLLTAAAGAAWMWVQSLRDGPVRVIGTVVPATEFDITSPISGRITRMHVRVGDEIAPGAPIVSFDVTPAVEAAERIERELAATTSEELRAQIALQSSVVEIDGLIDRKTIELRSLNITLANQRKLVTDGLAIEEQIQPAVLAVQQAEFELAALQEARWRLERPDADDVDSAAADRRRLTQQALQNRQQLDLGTLRSSRAAQIVQLHASEGAYVAAGAVVARAADLTTFSVRMTIDEQLASGQPWSALRVFVDGVELGASLPADLPESPGEVTVTLASPAHPGLRVGQRVEVEVER